PLVSVILPVYNNGMYVSEAINSVLAQTYKNLKIICIDDGFTDNTYEILKSFGNEIIVLQNSKNLGIAASRNAGIGRAHGEYLAFMDGDDVWRHDKIEIQMQAFANNPN